MTPEAKEARRLYFRDYREKNRGRISQQQKEWAKNNPDKVKAATERYWQKKAIETSGIELGGEA